MENWIPQLQVDAEHESRGADHLNHSRQIGEGVERLQPHDHLTRSTGQHLEGPAGVIRAGIYQQRAGKAGMELGKLAEQ